MMSWTNTKSRRLILAEFSNIVDTHGPPVIMLAVICRGISILVLMKLDSISHDFVESPNLVGTESPDTPQVSILGPL